MEMETIDFESIYNLFIFLQSNKRRLYKLPSVLKLILFISIKIID